MVTPGLKPSTTPSRMRQTAGVRNNNPLNVKGSGWKGQADSDSRGHAQFLNTVWGIRAAIITLRTYQLKHGLYSIADILSRWAPSTDTIGSIPGAPPNSPAEYTKFVGQEVGLPGTLALGLFEKDGTVGLPDTLFQVMSAMAQYENFAGYRLSRPDFDQALELL